MIWQASCSRVLTLCFSTSIVLSISGAAFARESSSAGALTLTLPQAIEQVTLRSPQLKAGQAAVRSAAAMTLQSGYLPNPEIEFEVEDYGLEGDDRGMDSSVTSVRLTQTFEIGGKRGKRRYASGLETTLAERDFEASILDLTFDVKERFIDLLLAQEQVGVATGAHKLALKVRDAVADRVKSGKVSPLELTKAQIELAGQRLELRRAERDLATARLSLAAMWNAPLADAEKLQAEGDLSVIPAIPELQQLQARLRNNPDFSRWAIEEDLAAAMVAQEKAGRIPDVTIMAGLSQERDSHNETAQLAVAFQLPLFNRNQGNVSAALADVERAREEQLANEISLRTHLTSAWNGLQGAIEQATAIQNEILPGARQAFAAAEEAYRNGKLDYLDVLDAQQTLAEMEMRKMETLAEVHKSIAEVERLVGGKKWK